MASRTILTSIDFWGKHEARILEVVTTALQMLAAKPAPSANEDQLNRTLCIYLHRANRKLLASRRQLDWPLFYEARNQPVAQDNVRARREDKRPDFQWGVYDHLESDPDKSAKFYVLEAKRLGAPTAKSPAWKFNANYVRDGVQRFVLHEWRYGLMCKSGSMIGYIQSMNGPSILIEVNQAARDYSIPEITLSVDGWKNRDVSRLDNCLIRPHIPISPFELRHLWVDLRRPSSSSSKKSPARKRKSPAK